MLLNNAQSDYLTLTTFDQAEYIESRLTDLYPQEFGKEASERGYHGLRWDGLFCGKGIQKKKEHYLLRASGENTETVFWRLARVQANCTRLDLQITIRMPQFWASRTLYDKLNAKDTKWSGRRLKAKIIQSGDGLDTVYIGSRQSESFIRIYVKPDEEMMPAYIRFEVEFKKSKAREVRRQIVSRETNARAVLYGELHKLPVYVSRTLESFSTALHGDRITIKAENEYTATSSMKWLESQVTPTITRLLLSHDEGDKMRLLLLQWVQEALDLNQVTGFDFGLDGLIENL